MTLLRVASAAEPMLIDRGPMSRRVHVVEDYETDIEKRWWMAGEIETTDVPPGSTRACRATLTHDFDDKMGDAKARYRAVIFNPVPGPPTQRNTRLAFRYKLRGTDAIRVQLYSLTNEYHRRLHLTSLEQDKWLDACVDMTQMRRPDGSGGALSAVEDERIDDIQFYIDPRGELLIDDMVLYEAGPEDEKHAFPKRIVFTAWFDTGKQGAEWPGRFDIVPHEPPLTWKTARSVVDERDGSSIIQISMRGRRSIPENARLRFRYRLTGGNRIEAAVSDRKSGKSAGERIDKPSTEQWAEGDVSLTATDPVPEGDEIRFSAPRRATLLVDDVMLYER